MEGLLLSKGCEGGLQDTQKEQRGREGRDGRGRGRQKREGGGWTELGNGRRMKNKRRSSESLDPASARPGFCPHPPLASSSVDDVHHLSALPSLFLS